MSFLEKLAGKKQGPLTTAEAIQRLRETEEMLMKKQEFLESKIENEYRSAKRNACRNKPEAIRALRRKKRFEKQLQQIDNTLTTLEFQRQALEVATTNTEVLKSMRSAANALRTNHLNVNIEKIHDMMDDIADQQDLVNEMTTAIGNPVGFDDDVDEDELEEELEALEEEILAEKLVEIPKFKVLPKVPGAKIVIQESSSKKKEESDEEDIRKLEQWAL